MKRVLFLCGGNSARSILAEALLNARDDPGWHAWSAGVEPKGVNPLTLVALRQAGIPFAGLRSKAVQEFLGESFDVVITLCQAAKGNCPIFPGSGLRLHWDLEDPAEATGSEAERLAAFHRVGDELDQRIECLLISGRLGSPVDSGRRDRLMETPKSRLRLEALIASPPTKKCGEIVVMLEELVEAFPDQVRLDVYLAGEQPSVQPTRGYQSFGKFKKIPSAFINGKVVAVREAPAKESLRKTLEEELSLHCDQW